MKELLAGLALDKQVLKDIAEGNLQALSGAGRPLTQLARSTTSADTMPAGSPGNHVGRSDTFQC